MDAATKQFIQAENEKLAAMIAKGFAVTATKEDILRLEGRVDKVEDRVGRVEDRLDNIDARMGRMEADIGALRGEIVYRHEFEDALGRIKYLEKKLGIESGVPS
jgi:predicted  nucleic acid-binding Zn-ribbon protein